MKRYASTLPDNSLIYHWWKSKWSALKFERDGRAPLVKHFRSHIQKTKHIVTKSSPFVRTKQNARITFTTFYYLLFLLCASGTIVYYFFFLSLLLLFLFSCMCAAFLMKRKISQKEIHNFFSIYTHRNYLLLSHLTLPRSTCFPSSRHTHGHEYSLGP